MYCLMSTFQFGMEGYKLPGVEKMRNKLIPSLVSVTKQEVLKIILACLSFTIMLDIWSSKNMMGYIGFVCNCVNSDFERFTIFLCLKKMTNRHTAENILAEYEQVLLDWNIPRSKV